MQLEIPAVFLHVIPKSVLLSQQNVHLSLTFLPAWNV